jgi:hypothetical protein
MSTHLKTTTFLLVPAVAAIALAACSGSGDLSLGVQNGHILGGDSGTDSGTDSASNDSAPPGDSDAPLPCARPANDECYAENGGGGTWPPECHTDFASSRAACGLNQQLASCGQYDLIESNGVDTGYSYYYDHATGQLVAILGRSANFGGSVKCVGGPPSGFSEPTCGAGTWCPVDAGPPSDASPDAAQPLACPTSAGAVCTINDGGGWPSSCYADWTHARAACAQTESYATCGQYDAINDIGVDTADRYFYDHASGNLVAVLSMSVFGDKCVGGPASGFIEPPCSSWTPCP